MDVGDDTSASDGCLDQGVQLFVTSDGELEMSGCDSLDLEVLGGITSELQDLSGQVLEDSCRVDGSSCADSLGLSHSSFDESVDSSDRELGMRETPTWSPALTDLLLAALLCLPPVLPPCLPPLPPLPAYERV